MSLRPFTMCPLRAKSKPQRKKKLGAKKKEAVKEETKKLYNAGFI